MRNGRERTQLSPAPQTPANSNDRMKKQTLNKNNRHYFLPFIYINPNVPYGSTVQKHLV
jgi:hypothetical protein